MQPTEKFSLRFPGAVYRSKIPESTLRGSGRLRLLMSNGWPVLLPVKRQDLKEGETMR